HYIFNQYNRSEYDNYIFDLHTTYVNVLQRTVTIELKDLDKEYSKAMPELIFNANDGQNDAWIYDGRARFRSEDNIVIELKTDADEHSVITDIGEKGIPITVKSITGVGEEGYGLDINKADNYIIKIKNTTVDQTGEKCSYVKVLPLPINVRVYVDKNSLIYGDSKPEASCIIEGDNQFMEDDQMRPNWVYSIGDTVLTELPTYLSVGTYEVSVEFDTFNADKIGNYNIVINGSAVFVVDPKEIEIVSFNVVGDSTFDYNGEHQHPNVNITFDGVVDDDEVSVEYRFYDRNGVRVDEPQNVGTYIARVEGTKVSNKEGTEINNNYILKQGVDYSQYRAEVTINPITVTVKVNDATRFYHIPGSLQALKANTDLTLEEYDDSDYVGEGELPYILLGDGRFISSDEIGYSLAVVDNEYFEELGVYNHVVKINFTGASIEAGNYVIDEENSIWGSLRVLDASFDKISRWLYVTYEGKRIGREIDRNDVVYTGENLFDKFGLYAYNTEIYNQLSWKFTDADGNDVNGVIKDAGTYKMVIEASGDDSPFTGEHTITFVVNQAVRNITAADIKMEVHYDKLVFSSDIPGLVYSVNAVDGVDAWRTPTNGTYVYTNVNALNNYFIRIKVEQGYDPNYYDSNILEIFVQTGINAGDLADQFNAIDTITFSNLAVYLALKDRIGFVHADDMGAIPTGKIAELDASIEKLISDANAAVAGAQNVTAKAMGKSNNSKTVATAMALSSTSLGLGVVGLMLGSIVAKKRKEDEMEAEQSKVKNANGKKYAKRFVIVIAIMLVAVMAFAGCNGETMKQEELLDLASYNTPSNEKSRDYDITVSHESTIIYRNVNGVETTVNDNINVPKFEMGSTGSGLDFNVDYFENISYVTSKSTATFTADVKNVSAFLGNANATDASVIVVADIQNKRLNSIEITYSEGKFKTTISTTLNY
ncbi:MAG: hypothetical protein K2J13_00445, partial [Clostridia bacterium]|nr:hypothetical protein [Clostridia bacterium]